MLTTKRGFQAVDENENGWFTMSSAAKLIGIKGMGRTKLFAFLRDERVLKKTNEPYQVNVDSGYFKYKVKYLIRGDGSLYGMTKVTLISDKGIQFIIKIIKEKENQNEK